MSPELYRGIAFCIDQNFPGILERLQKVLKAWRCDLEAQWARGGVRIPTKRVGVG
jgi:hypothetical protein